MSFHSVNYSIAACYQEYFYCPSTNFNSSKLSMFLNCCSHPMTNRIVVDCFYFTQAITLSLLVYFNSYLQRFRASPLTPVDYHRVQRFIVYECCCTDPKTVCKHYCLLCIYYSISTISCHYILVKCFKNYLGLLPILSSLEHTGILPQYLLCLYDLLDPTIQVLVFLVS